MKVITTEPMEVAGPGGIEIMPAGSRAKVDDTGKHGTWIVFENGARLQTSPDSFAPVIRKGDTVKLKENGRPHRVVAVRKLDGMVIAHPLGMSDAAEVYPASAFTLGA